LTQYADWAYGLAPELRTAVRACKTPEFLRRATAISTAFHRTMRTYDAGSSRERFRDALSLATKEISGRLIAPWGSIDEKDAIWADHLSFNRDHLPCLRRSGLSDRQAVTAVVLTLCQILRSQGARL
jgi:hypothetical protein